MHRFTSMVMFLVIAFFGSHAQAQVESATYVQADHILLGTEETATQALKLINGGVSFPSLAARWSEDRGSAAFGGQLQVMRCAEYVPEFASFVCSAELGKAGVVKTVFGWHVVVVKSRSTDQRQVTPLDQAIRAPAFKATVSLSCALSDLTFSVPIEIDLPNKMARFGGQMALVLASDVDFRLQRSSGDLAVIDRTTGLAVWYLPGKEPITGLTCRPSSQRLF